MEGFSGEPDPKVIRSASAAGRILFTLDKGIGDLRHDPARQHAGVVLFRPAASGRGAVAAFVRDHLDQVLGMDLHGKPAVVGANRIRIRYQVSAPPIGRPGPDGGAYRKPSTSIRSTSFLSNCP